MSDDPSLQDLPIELLSKIASSLDMKSLNALRQASKTMKAVADDAAARDAKKIQAFVQYVRDKFKKEVLTDMNEALSRFEALKNAGVAVKKLKPPTFSSPAKKADYKAAKAEVTKALQELAGTIQDIQANILTFLGNLDRMARLLEKDLQTMASASKEERKTKRGGQSQMTYDELEHALETLDQARNGAATVQAQLERTAAELSEFGKTFSSKFKNV